MHIIRLRGPWEVEPLARYERASDGTYGATSSALPAGARVKMPADWAGPLGEGFRGHVRHRRTFQKPTGLDAGERVWLVVEPPRSQGAVRLNGTALGEVRFGEPAGRYDITERLLEHNELTIVVEHPALDESGTAEDDGNSQLPGGLVGEVRLEIEE